MKSVDYNFVEFVKNLDTPKIFFYREVRQKMHAKGIRPVSIQTIDRWARGDSQTTKAEYLSVLSEMTGIESNNLFRF